MSFVGDFNSTLANQSHDSVPLSQCGRRVPNLKMILFSKVYLFVESLLANSSLKTAISSVECTSELRYLETLVSECLT